MTRCDANAARSSSNDAAVDDRPSREICARARPSLVMVSKSRAPRPKNLSREKSVDRAFRDAVRNARIATGRTRVSPSGASYIENNRVVVGNGSSATPAKRLRKRLVKVAVAPRN